MSAGIGAALRAAEERYTAANPRSLERIRAAAGSMPGGNTRTSLHYSPFPVTFAGGQDQHLTDLDGHVYTDLLGEYSAGLYGHSHPVIVGAARKALDEGIAFGGPNTYDVDFADLLRARFPSVDLLRFTNSGTEANLMAIATARVVTGRDGVLVFHGGYHGGVLSYRGAAPLNVPYPTVVGVFNDVGGTVALIERHAADLAVVVVEPVIGGGGVIPGTPEFLRALRDTTSRLGILLHFDEVMTSRLGPSGVQGRTGITPDLTTFGKYLGGGFSFGAFGGARSIMERYDPGHPATLGHPGTFNNNTLTMAAGAAGLREVFTPEEAVALNERGDGLREALNDVFTGAGVAMQATGLGSLVGIHFQRGPIERPDQIRPADAERALLHLELMARGYYSARRSYLALSVALTPDDLAGFADAVRDVVTEHAALLRD